MSSGPPSWPSLYNPGLEILHIAHHPPRQPGGSYLDNAFDIFRFTLYWTLIFYTPFFFVCGLYAFCNYAFPPTPSSPFSLPDSSSSLDLDDHHDHDPSTPTTLRRSGNTYVPLQHLRSSPQPHAMQSHSNLRRATPASGRSTVQTTTTTIPKKNERRSRVTFGLLVFIIFLVVGLAGAVIGSAVVGFTVLGLYRSANFSMSTWIPFLMAVIQVLVGLLSIWPSIIEII